MYKEIAFDPECMAEYEYYGLLKQSFGFEKGRYVIASTKEWAKEAYQAAKDSQIQTVKKKSITNYLNKLQKEKTRSIFLLPTYRKEVGKESIDNWSAWLDHQNNAYSFSSIISERLGEKGMTYGQINENDENWIIPPTRVISKTASEIVNNLKPIISLSDIVLIVDSYFSLANNAVLKEIFNEIQERKNIVKITLVTSINSKDPNRIFKNEYVDKFTYIPSFELIVVPERSFHDRYFITNNAAIKAGHGFSEATQQGTQSDRLSLSYVGENEYVDVIDFLNKTIEDKVATLNVLA
ncbi:DEAD/DEAH box helicase [Erwinia rhapontici]|uniref:hypothetical protein n=1 Tax=Erwinia rhapontici TaxID=55212 RepID=UPI003D35CA2C